MRAVVIHSHDSTYAARVAADLFRRGEHGRMHPASADLDEAVAFTVVDRWMEVAEKLIVYVDVKLTEPVLERVRVAKTMGLEIAYRHAASAPAPARTRLRDRLSWLVS